jgi:hypothetical protein
MDGNEIITLEISLNTQPLLPQVCLLKVWCNLRDDLGRVCLTGTNCRWATYFVSHLYKEYLSYCGSVFYVICITKYTLICFKFCFDVNLNVNFVCLIIKLKSVYCIPNLSPKPAEDLNHTGCKVLTAVTMNSAIIRDVPIPCSLAEVFRLFGGMCYLYLQDWREVKQLTSR